MWINSHIAVCLMKYVYYDRMCLSFMPRQIIICNDLTHWGWVTHICVSKLTSVGSDNGLSPGRRQAIIWTSAGILLIGPLGTNFRENLIEIHIFSFNKMHLKMSSGKWRTFCLGINVLGLHSMSPALSDGLREQTITLCLIMVIVEQRNSAMFSGWIQQLGTHTCHQGRHFLFRTYKEGL